MDTPTPKPRKKASSGASTLQPAITAAISRATFREWARVGYARLAMEVVARRAGVGKAAVYRRWISKEALVADLMSQVGVPLGEVPSQDSFAAEVACMLTRIARLLRHPLVRRILPDLHAEMARSTELATKIHEGVQAARRQQGVLILQRAVARGEVAASANPELFLDLVSPLYWRSIVLGGTITPGYLQDLTAVIVKAFSLGVNAPDAGAKAAE